MPPKAVVGVSSRSHTLTTGIVRKRLATRAKVFSDLRPLEDACEAEEMRTCLGLGHSTVIQLLQTDRTCEFGGRGIASYRHLFPRSSFTRCGFPRSWFFKHNDTEIPRCG